MAGAQDLARDSDSGLAVGLTSGLAWMTISRVRDHSVLRIEKSIQIGRPVEEVFFGVGQLCPPAPHD